MSDRYEIAFDFDCEGEPPRVEIYDNGTESYCGGTVVEVHEEPTSPLGKLVDGGSGGWYWDGEYSWEEEDWEAGPLAKRILEMLNGGE